MLGCSMGLEIELSFYGINLYTATSGLYLGISGADCKCGIIYSAYREFILYCNWKRLTAETFGTVRCKTKILETELGKEILTGEVKGIEVWRKSSKLQ